MKCWSISICFSALLGASLGAMKSSGLPRIIRPALVSSWSSPSYSLLPLATQKRVSEQRYQRSCEWVEKEQKEKRLTLKRLTYKETSVSDLLMVGPGEKSEIKSGTLYVGSFGPVTARDVEHLLAPLATATDTMIAAPLRFSFEDTLGAQDMWSSEWQGNLEVAHEMVRYSASEEKLPVFLVAQAAGVPIALKFLAAHPLSIRAALLLNPFVDMRAQIKKEPSVQKYLASLCARVGEGEEEFIKNRFNIKKYLETIHTPLVIMHADAHYGLDREQAEILFESAREMKVPVEKVILSGEERDLSEKGVSTLISYWKEFQQKESKKMRDAC